MTSHDRYPGTETALLHKAAPAIPTRRPRPENAVFLGGGISSRQLQASRLAEVLPVCLKEIPLYHRLVLSEAICPAGGEDFNATVASLPLITKGDIGREFSRNLYGSTETGHLLMETGQGKMSPSLETAFLEIVGGDSGPGELVVTTLTNDTCR